MYRNSIIGKSSKVSDYTSGILEDINIHPAKVEKSAASIPVFNRKRFADSKKFLSECTSYGLGVYQAKNGSVWKVVKDADGVSWLHRDAGLSEENDFVKECMGSAKSANFFE